MSGRCRIQPPSGTSQRRQCQNSSLDAVGRYLPRRGLSIVSSLVRRPLERRSASKFAVVVGVATEEAVAQEEEEHESAILGIFRRRQCHN